MSTNTKLKAIYAIFFVAIFFLANPPLIAQSFSNQEKKKITEAVDSLLDLYKTYSTFTEDYMEISSLYQRKFSELFQSGQSLVCMDLSNEIQQPASVLKYVDFAGKIFNEGLGVKISDIRKEKPKKAMIKQVYEIKVRFNKHLSGYAKTGRKYEKTVALVMTIQFNNVNGPFKIVSLLNEKQDKRAINQKKTNELNLNIIPSYTFITAGNDSVTNLTSKGSFSTHFNINYYKYFPINDRLYYGAGLGFGLSGYQATLSFNHYSQPESDKMITDMDNDTLRYLVNFGKTSDEVSVSFIDIILWPVRFRHFSINNNFEYFISIGLKFSSPYKAESKLTGDDTTTGHYYNIPLELNDVGYYGYGLQTVNGTSNELTPTLSNFIIMGIINAGLSFTIGKSLVFGVGVNVDFAFNNLNKEKSPYLAYRNDKEITNEYRSIINISKYSKPVSMGLLFGLNYRF